MNVGRHLRDHVKAAVLAVAVLPSLVQAFIPPVSGPVGSIRALVDATSAETVAEYAYDPYGVLLGETGEKADACPFRFSSKYYDPETKLLYFGYRYYNPASTKWLTVDPLQERGGLNFTAYCGGDPVNQVDPMGLAFCDWWDYRTVGFIAGGFFEGLEGGTSILVNTFTFGGSDKIGLTESDQYQGGAYSVSRVSSTVAREALITAGTMGVAQVARGGVESARALTYSGRAVNYIAQSRKVTESG